MMRLVHSKLFFRISLPVAGLLLLISDLVSQQLPVFTQYREHHGYINPASVSYDYFIYDRRFQAGVSYRTQWQGIDGAPATQLLQASYVIDNAGSVGLVTGALITNDHTGPLGLSGIHLRTGVLLSGDPYYGFVSIGLMAGINQYRIKTSEFEATDLQEVFDRDLSTKLFPDVGLGIFGQIRLGSHNLYGGLSMPQTFGFNVAFDQSGRSFDIKRVPHYYALAGAYIFLDDLSFLEPSLWVRTLLNGDYSVDLNIRYNIQDQLWVGAGYSLNRSIHAEAGFILGEQFGWENQFRIGYGFDNGYNPAFGASFGASHESILPLPFNIPGSIAA
jgi:type IX secretion system PorP/SprF family membrane protein